MTAAGNDPVSSPNARGSRASRWPIVLVALIAAAVLLPRAYLVNRAHTETCDEDILLMQGMEFWHREPGLVSRGLNDPHLGMAIGALPLVLRGGEVPSSAAVRARWDGVSAALRRLSGDLARDFPTLVADPIVPVVDGVAETIPPPEDTALYYQPYTPEAGLRAVALWKAALFVPPSSSRSSPSPSGGCDACTAGVPAGLRSGCFWSSRRSPGTSTWARWT